jgi:hypothetical protein
MKGLQTLDSCQDLKQAAIQPVIKIRFSLLQVRILTAVAL